MTPNFDTMDLPTMLQFKRDHQVDVPMIGDLMTIDVQRQGRRKSKLELGLIRVPTGRESYTTYTTKFSMQLRELLQACYLEPKGDKQWELWREMVSQLTFQELVEFNGKRNLVGAEALDALYETERVRGVPLHECTEHLKREGFTQAFTPDYVKDLREAVLAAIIQKEKDFKEFYDATH